MLTYLLNLALLPTLLGLYGLYLAVQRLCFHPLAGIPGPKLAAISRWYEGYYDFVKGGQYFREIRKMHEKHGPIVRISPYEVHINDPYYFEHLFRQGGGRWNKHGFTYEAFGCDTATICTQDHDLHRRRRAALNPFYSKASILSRKSLVVEKIELLVARMEPYIQNCKVLNIGIAYSALSTDISTELNLGKAYGNLNREDFNPGMSEMSQNSGPNWQGMKHVPSYRLYTVGRNAIKLYFGNKAIRTFTASLGETYNRTRLLHLENVNPETKKPKRPATLVDQIMQSSQLTDLDKTFERILPDVGTVVGAGGDTTAHTLRVITFWLYSDPNMLQRLRNELRDNIDPENPWDLGRLEQLPYLNQVILEGLRLNPGILTRMARIAPDRDLQYEDYVLPAGTPISMTTYLMHTDAKIYPDPFRFDPDRWADPEKRREEKTFAPFSRGTRNCLGMHLAWMELYFVVATMVSRFNFQLVDTTAEDVEAYCDHFLPGTKTDNGVRVIATHVKY